MGRTSDADIPFTLDSDLAKASDSVSTPGRKVSSGRHGRGGGGAARSTTGGHQHQRQQQQQRPTPERILEKEQSPSTGRSGKRKGDIQRTKKSSRKQSEQAAEEKQVEDRRGTQPDPARRISAGKPMRGASDDVESPPERRKVGKGTPQASAMSPRLPTAPEMGIATEINAVEKDIMGITTEIIAVEEKIKEVESKISRVEVAMNPAEGVRYLGISDPDKLFEFLNLLLDKEKQLRDEKKLLLDEKKQLRDEKKQLRDEMLRLPPSSGEVFQELLNFSEKLTEATLENNVLSLPKDAPFLGDNSLGSALFVRQCYVDLKNIIFQLVKDGTRDVVVSGTPGTGKSVFGLYLLYLLRKERNTVIVQLRDNWYRFSDEDGVQMWGPREVIRSSYLNDENAWFLCDPKEKEGPFQSFRGVTVVMISPDPDRIRDYNKQVGPIQLFVPMWTLDELEQCRKLIYPDVTEDDVKIPFMYVGGVAREAFNKLKFDSKMLLMEERARNVGVEDLDNAVFACNSHRLSTKMVGDALFSIFPKDDYRSYGVTWASREAMEMTMDALRTKVVNMADALLLSNILAPRGVTGGEIGSMFERRAHVQLMHDTPLRRYILGGKEDFFKFSFSSNEEFDGARDLIPTTLTENRYYKPKKQNFQAIDARGECDNVLYLFQMKTRGAKFPVPLLANDGLLAKWGKPRVENATEQKQNSGYEKCVFVYVVPSVGSANFNKVMELAKKWVGKDSRNSETEATCMWIDEVWVIGIPFGPASMETFGLPP